MDFKTWVASGLGLLYVLVLLLLLWQFGFGAYETWFPKANYDRSVSILNLLSALGTAAIGVLLGTKIEQVKVETNKKNAVAESTKKLSGAAQNVLAEADKTQHPGFAPARLDEAAKQLRDAIAETNGVLRAIDVR